MKNINHSGPGLSFLALNYYINSANGANSLSSTNLNSTIFSKKKYY